MTHHDTDVVSSLRLEIAQRMTQDRFDLWFAETELEVDWVARVVKVLASSQFTLDWLRANVRQDVQQACEGVLGPDFVVQYHQSTQTPSSVLAPSGSAHAGAAHARPGPAASPKLGLPRLRGREPQASRRIALRNRDATRRSTSSWSVRPTRLPACRHNW